jgi:tetratricopeptide (TPR) repeat protein
VRLRFVEAGEDFVFGRDAQAVDFAPAGAPRLAMWIALGLLVTGAVVALFLILSGNEKAGASRGTTAAGGESTATGRSDAAAAGQPEVSDGRDVPVPEVSDELSAQLGAARQAIENEKWVEAQQAARAALVHDPNHAESQAVLEHAKAEIAAEELYNQFTKAVNTKNYGQIATLFNQFDPESVYRVKAQPDHDRMKADYVRARSFSGKRLADRGRCREQNKLAREAGRIWPEAAEAVLSHLCKEIPGGSAGGNTGGGGGASGGGASGGGASGGAATGGAGGGGGGGTAAASGPTFDQLLDEARKAAFDGHYGKAIRSCEAALEKKPNDQEAIKTCAVAACKLKSAARAKKYLRKLTSETRQQMVRQICLQSGVTDI